MLFLKLLRVDFSRNLLSKNLGVQQMGRDQIFPDFSSKIRVTTTLNRHFLAKILGSKGRRHQKMTKNFFFDYHKINSGSQKQ
jgi:hypothetical protein